MKINDFGLWRLFGALIAGGTLSACAQIPSLSFDMFQRQDWSAASLNQDIGGDVGQLAFAFEADNKADKKSDEVGVGYIVVLREGKELQALPHAFEMPPESLDAHAWLSFRDFNGDGLMDFKVARLAPAPNQLPLDSIFQFDPKSGKFAMVDALSGVGEVEPASPGCVSMKLITAAGSPKLESLCFVAASAQWILAKPGMGSAQIAKTQADQYCDPLAPKLKNCRRARVEAEGQLLKLVQEYRAGKRSSLLKVQGKGYADAYAKTQDWDHMSWRRYRDARCAVQVREQALSTKDLPAATELCRYDWSVDQLRRYQDQVARLTEKK